MTEEMQRMGKILVEAEGGCWHKVFPYAVFKDSGLYYCEKCKAEFNLSESFFPNPDFSEWTNFGKLLKIKDSLYERMQEVAWLMLHRDISDIIDKTKTDDIDQIPTLVARELVKVLEGK